MRTPSPMKSQTDPKLFKTFFLKLKKYEPSSLPVTPSRSKYSIYYLFANVLNEENFLQEIIDAASLKEEDFKDLIFSSRVLANTFTSFSSLASSQNKFLNKIQVLPSREKLKKELEHNQLERQNIVVESNIKQQLTIQQVMDQIHEKKKSDNFINSFQKTIKKKDLQTQIMTIAVNLDDQKKKQVDPRQIPHFYEEIIQVDQLKNPERPTLVEGATLQIVGDKAYIYGGIGSEGLRSSIWQFCLKKNLWTLLRPKELAPESARTGHSMIVWKHYLVVFGGSSHFNIKIKSREVYSTILYFSMISYSWQHIFPVGEQVEPRRQHRAVLWNNKYMIIVGGVGHAEKMLKETLMFNLESHRWIFLTDEKHLEVEVAYHTLCVAPNNVEFHKSTNLNTNTVNYLPDVVYLFGGKNNLSQCNNDLYKLLFETGNVLPYGWQKISTQGKPPPKCHSHTMEYWPKGNCLIIIGGRTDEVQEGGSVLKQVFLFFINHSVWQEVVVAGNFNERCCHCSGLHNSRIILFGGISSTTYLDAHLYAIETDFQKVQAFLQRQKLDKVEQNLRISHSPQPGYNGKKKIKNLWDMNDAPVQGRRMTAMEKFRLWQTSSPNLVSYLPIPKKKAPKIRYDLFIPIVKQILLASEKGNEKKIRKITEEEQF